MQENKRRKNKMSEAIKNRYEFTIFFDVENGNPNGDPDSGGMPRIDPETGYGIVTDVCLKRKIRNYVEATKENSENSVGYGIYIKNGVVLNALEVEAGKEFGIDNELKELQKASTKKEAKEIGKKIKKDNPEIDKLLFSYMCNNYYDIRTFGAVMTTFVKGALNCGQVRGPVQLGFARSVDRILPQEISITRVAITTEADAEKKDNEMGRKYIVPYGLYRCDGYVSANLARKTTGFSEDDLNLLWEAMVNMFDTDHSAARGKMATRKLIVFKHDSELGTCPAYKLFEAVSAKRKEGIEVPRNFYDYEIKINKETIPSDVEVTEII
jgi:CRISPR-associated protein Csd2